MSSKFATTASSNVRALPVVSNAMARELPLLSLVVITLVVVLLITGGAG
jgi:hypothetical protein